MTINRPGRDEQTLGDRRIAHALGHQRKNLGLSTRQPEPITASRGPRAPRNGANAFCAHSFAQGLRCWGRAEPFEYFKCFSLFGFGVSLAENSGLCVLYGLRTPCVRGKTEEGLVSVGLLVSEPRKMA